MGKGYLGRCEENAPMKKPFSPNPGFRAFSSPSPFFSRYRYIVDEYPDEWYLDDQNLEKTAVDRRGIPRLNLVRRAFYEGNVRDLTKIAKVYLKWVNEKEFIKIRVEDERGRKIEEIISECAKRGNGLYRWKLKQKLKWLEKLPYAQFFNPKNRNPGKKTKALFVTLTYDTKRCSWKEAWENIGKEWNRWISNVRYHYGRVSAFRVFEAHKNGYPHVHAILIFEDKEFNVVCKKIGGAFRIFRCEQEVFRKSWHSFVDIVALYEISPRLQGYIVKYLMKVLGEVKFDIKRLDEENVVLTLTLLWLFRKQSYAISGEFRRMVEGIVDLIIRGGIQRRIYEFVPVPEEYHLKYRLIPSPSGYRTWAWWELGKDRPPSEEISLPVSLWVRERFGSVEARRELWREFVEFLQI